jgi:hemoglobin/transferrin/lactoferrin receptor protein
MEAASRTLGTATASYRYLTTRATLEDPLAGGRLDYAPAHRVSLHSRTTVGGIWLLDLFGLFLSGRQDAGLTVDDHGVATSHVQLPPYLVVGARAGVKLHDSVTASLVGTNLFNARYEETFGFPAPGLRLFGEVSLSY